MACRGPLEPAHSGRPRQYCSPRCRQRAYRQRARWRDRAPDEDGAELISLTRHLRDNADRLWLLVQGWHPPPDDRGSVSIPDLAADTAQLAAQLADLDEVRLPKPRKGDETDDETRSPPSPDRGENAAH